MDFSKVQKKAVELNKEDKVGSYVYRPSDGLAAYSVKGIPVLHLMYKCQFCGHEFDKSIDAEWPYKIKCESCRKIVLKSSKPRGRRKKKKD